MNGTRVVCYISETSQFDPERFWNHGTQCWEVRRFCRIPADVPDDETGEWIDDNPDLVEWIE